MNVNNLFVELQNKFNLIDSGVDAKIKIVNELHELDCEKINNKFELNYIINGLNEYREVALKEINEKRITQINDMNEFCSKIVKTLNEHFVNGSQDPESFKKHSGLYEHLIEEQGNYMKNSSVYFMRSRVKNVLNLLSKFKFTQPFDFFKLNKYSDFIMTKKRIRLNLANLPSNYDSCNLSFIDRKRFLILPANRIFVCAKIKNFFYEMLIVDQDGRILYSREFRMEFEQFKIFKTTSSHIIRLFRNKDESGLHSNVEIYSFKLELSHSFKLDISYYSNFIISNNEIAFQNNFERSKILIYNLDHLRSIYINLNTEISNGFFYIYDPFSYKLLHFNNEKLFFFKNGEIINIIDRGSLLILANISVCTYRKNYFKFDRYSQIYDLNDEENVIHVYNANGAMSFDLPLKEKFKSLRFTLKDTIVYNQKSSEDFIEFDEY
jgi:hypothetical protein